MEKIKQAIDGYIHEFDDMRDRVILSVFIVVIVLLALGLAAALLLPHSPLLK